jgi:hypothetical protein
LGKKDKLANDIEATIWTKRLKNINKSIPSQALSFPKERHLFDSIFSQLATSVPNPGLARVPERLNTG